MYKNTSSANFFGASKKGRKLNMETLIISERIPDSLWMDYKKNNHSKNNIWIKIDNKNLYYLKEGKFILVRYKIPPYLWRNIPGIPKKQKVYVETGSIKG